MIDVDKCVNDYEENFTDLTGEQKQRFSTMASTMGNLLNCIWENREDEDNEHRISS